MHESIHYVPLSEVRSRSIFCGEYYFTSIVLPKTQATQCPNRRNIEAIVVAHPPFYPINYVILHVSFKKKNHIGYVFSYELMQGSNYCVQLKTTTIPYEINHGDRAVVSA